MADIGRSAGKGTAGRHLAVDHRTDAGSAIFFSQGHGQVFDNQPDGRVRVGTPHGAAGLVQKGLHAMGQCDQGPFRQFPVVGPFHDGGIDECGRRGKCRRLQPPLAVRDVTGGLVSVAARRGDQHHWRQGGSLDGIIALAVLKGCRVPAGEGRVQAFGHVHDRPAAYRDQAVAAPVPIDRCQDGHKLRLHPAGDPIVYAQGQPRRTEGIDDGFQPLFIVRIAVGQNQRRSGTHSGQFDGQVIQGVAAAINLQGTFEKKRFGQSHPLLLESSIDRSRCAGKSSPVPLFFEKSAILDIV